MTREEEIKEAAFEYADTELVEIINFEKEVAFIEGARWADTHPHWISAEDKMSPKKSEYDDLSNNVLATDGKGIYESVYNYDFEDWFTHDMCGLDNITHWMSLPSIETIKTK